MSNDNPIVPFGDINPREIDWTWQRHLPAGMITALGGQPGQGKSLISFRIAADVSNRGGNVLISNHEDHPETVQRPRIEAAGADLSRVHFIDLPALPDGLEALESAIEATDAQLVILDPFASHVNVHVGNVVGIRNALSPVERLAQRTGCAVLIIAHQIKYASSRATPLSTLGGPSGAGLAGLCRAVYLAGKDPTDDERFVMVNAKALGPKPSNLVFTLDAAFTKGSGVEGGFVHYSGETEITAKRLIEAQYKDQEGRAPKQSKQEIAAEWLMRYLFLAAKPQTPAQVAKDAAKQDPPITYMQLRRATKELGLSDKPKGGRGAKWGLPTELREVLAAQYGESAPDPQSEIPDALGPDDLKGGDGS
jgi:putative DNA primase/helicase